jgi:hypothetical protein
MMIEPSSPPRQRRPYRRTKFSRECAPLGTVRIRATGEKSDRQVRMIKVAFDGPVQKRWMEYARWAWIQIYGAIPEGHRIYHRDFDTLNDRFDNLICWTPGQYLAALHKHDPAWSVRTHSSAAAACTRWNVEHANARRLAGWLPSQWYAVDFTNAIIFNAPRRVRWRVYIDQGVPQRIAEKIRGETQAARSGDTAAAAFVFRQANTLDTFDRRVRASGIGWPGVRCYSACVLCALLDAGGTLSTPAVLDAVSVMRERYDWTPHDCPRQQLSSALSELRGWIRREGQGRYGTMLSLTPAALRHHVQGPRIVAIEGRRLSEPAFEHFRRVEVADYKPEPRDNDKWAARRRERIKVLAA